jgi:hypothetical protein
MKIPALSIFLMIVPCLQASTKKLLPEKEELEWDYSGGQTLVAEGEKKLLSSRDNDKTKDEEKGFFLPDKHVEESIRVAPKILVAGVVEESLKDSYKEKLITEVPGKEKTERPSCSSCCQAGQRCSGLWMVIRYYLCSGIGGPSHKYF